MKTRFFLVVLWCAACNLAWAQASPAEQVKAAFASYKTAIMNDQGETAVNFVDSRTIRYYGQMLDMVRQADSAQIETLNIMDKLMVFSIRHRTPRADVLAFDARALLVYAIKSGMVAKSSVAALELGEVTIDGAFAKAQVVSQGKAAPFYFQFNDENGWKLDLTALFPISVKVFQALADDSRQPTNEYLFSLLEMLTSRKPGPEIWQPVK
jgi:hypothetical protein